jgi:protochlorophyllide reductase
MDPLFQSAAMGALPQLYAATASDVQGGEFFGPGGLANLKGYPVRCRRAASANDPVQRQRLWLLSEQLSH